MAAKLIGERLPQNWSYAVTRDGRIFFIDDGSQLTTWLHPVTGQPVQTGNSSTPDFGDESDSDDLPHDLDTEERKSRSQDLPLGWEQGRTIDGTVYYIDHNHGMTTYENPVRPPMEHPLRSPSEGSPSPLKQGPTRKSGKSKTIKTPAASRGENSKVILRGWLQKQESSGLKLWKKKWCVLADFGLFFYKDEAETACIGSILLPSYTISPCSPAALGNKRYAFKAEHDNMKTFYFAADSQVEMDRWVEGLRMASLVQKAPQSGIQKLIPKSPIMSWTDTVDGPSVAPPDMQQYPFSGYEGDTTLRAPSESSFRERSPLQSRENTLNTSQNMPPDFVNRSYSQDPQDEQGSFRGSQRGSQRSSQRSYDPRDIPRQGYGPSDPNRSFDPRYPPPERTDRHRGSTRSSQDPRNISDDQRSRPPSGQFSSSTLPRDSRPHQSRNPPQNQTLPNQGQSYNSLPRDTRSRLPPDDMDRPYGHSSPRQSMDRPGKGREQLQDSRSPKRKDDNPYMMMMSPQSQAGNERRMDPSRHSNRPLPQEPAPEPQHDRQKSGGGDYASLTRYKNKWPNQNLAESAGVSAHSPPSQPQGHPSRGHHSQVHPAQGHPSQGHPAQGQMQQPDLYVDIPHTYVNVYDESQIRERVPDLPMRPPLPAEMRGQIVRDIAESHSPNTQQQLLQAETALEQRMRQPGVFNYPTPTRESLPAFPQESPHSQHNHRTQPTHEQRQPQHYQDDKGRQPQLPPRRPDLAPLSSPEPEIARQDARDNFSPPPSSGSYHISHTRESSENTITNEDRNERINEFYGLAKYTDKNTGRYGEQDKNRIMSDLNVNSRTLPTKPKSGLTGEKDFRLRSLPDHVQSMPAIYHEQEPLSIVVPDRDQVVNSYMNLSNAPPPAINSMPMTNCYADQTERKSAFRPLAGSNTSLQRYPSDTLQKRGYPGDYGKPLGYQDQDHDQTDVKRLSSASSQLSQSRLQRKPDGFPGQSPPEMAGQGQSQGQRGQRSAPMIHTVREEPDMPDSQVIETELPKRQFLLSGPRLRMSISATDLLGKTHDELVLLLIQLRRDKAELTATRDGIRKTIEQHRPKEIYYRKLQNEGRPIDREREAIHQQYMETKHELEEVEKKLEVYKPLVNLVCNMVTMGSLYGGDNLMLATEYRKHLLTPEQYSPPKKMLEFSRRHQENQIVQDIEDDVRQLTKEQADLEEKLDRLYELDRIMQEQSFAVTSLKEDREMLERALGGLLKKQDQHCTNPRELDKLIHQQRTIEKELSRVLQQLAQASKELEETTAENNKIEHEVALLRSKVHGNVSRSKSAPSLTSESLHTKMKMEKDLAKVQDIMAGLSEQGARLQQVMSNLRQGKHQDDTPTSPGKKGPEMNGKQQKSTETYYETDLDTSQAKDLAQVTALLASYQLAPAQQSAGEFSPEPLRHRTVVPSYASPQNSQSREDGASAFRTVSPGRKETEALFHAAPVQTLEQHPPPSQQQDVLETDGGDQWDIAEADDNTKRFFGLIPKNMPKSQTVRDVKRNSESRKEVKKKDDDPPSLRVGVIPSTPDYTDTTFHVYENLPQQKSAPAVETTIKPAWASVAASVAVDADNPSSAERRRSQLHLITPKPFTPYGSKPSIYSSVSSVAGPSTSTSNGPSDPNTLQSQLYTSSSSLNFKQSNDTYTPTEPIISVSTGKTPPPPPIRGTSKLVTAEVSKQQFSSLPHLAMTPGQNSSPRNYVLPVPSILKRGRGADKTRYMTISSSQPVKLETSVQQSPKQYSQAGDLISSMEVPDIVKSSTKKKDHFDERTIDREILFFPEKVDIPERYMPDSDDDEENMTEEERALRKEKAAKIKKILTQQSVHSLSQPDVSRVAGEVHERVQQEKRIRAQLLGINQELAEQVKLKSRQFAAERRKTWSGTPLKSESSDGELERSREAEDNSNERYPQHMEDNSDANNNSYSAAERYPQHTEDHDQYAKDSSLYQEDSFNKGDNSGTVGFSYLDAQYKSTSYTDRPNFKI